LLRNLIDIASKGGNYLLNVGPTAEGVIPAPEVERLQALGTWLKVNGEAVYGTGPTPFGAEAGDFSATQKDRHGQPLFVPKWEWRCTTKPGRLYIEIFAWPTGKFQLPAVKDKITQAYLLADPQHTPLSFTQEADKVVVTLPAAAPDAVASVLCLETAQN
jgi:alpha-L-fucosidase